MSEHFIDRACLNLLAMRDKTYPRSKRMVVISKPIGERSFHYWDDLSAEREIKPLDISKE